MKWIKNLFPLWIYYLISLIIWACLLFVHADVAFISIIFILTICFPVYLIMVLFIGYFVGKQIQKRIEHNTIYERIFLSIGGGILIGSIIPLLIEIGDFIKWGKFDIFNIFNSFMTHFEGNYFIPITAIITIVALWLGMEITYRGLIKNGII